MTAASTPRNVGKGGALNYALRRYAKGDLVMTIDADSMVSSQAIERAITYFADPSVVGVAANVRVIPDHTILGTLQKLEHMIGYRAKKVYSLLNCEFVIGGVASTYRMDILRKVGFYDTDTITEDIGLSLKVISSGNKQRRLVYAADVEAMTEGVATYRALFKQRFRWKYGSMQNLVKYRRLIGRPGRGFTPSLTIYRLPIALVSELVLALTPLLWGYIAYVSITTRDPSLIVGAYCTTTLYVLVTLWFDEHTPLGKRLTLSADAMHAYLIFFTMDIVQFAGINRCAYKIKDLLTQKNIGSVWKSPDRKGAAIKVVANK
jgi:cellulose synthase/poly-beta-1,6-N-acetylglucosamine synthase-like glycosyltransferase